MTVERSAYIKAEGKNSTKLISKHIRIKFLSLPLFNKLVIIVSKQ